MNKYTRKEVNKEQPCRNSAGTQGNLYRKREGYKEIHTEILLEGRKIKQPLRNGNVNMYRKKE